MQPGKSRMWEGYLMNRSLKVVAVATLLAAGATHVQAADCADDPRTTGLSRTVAVDSTGGKAFGRLQYKATAPVRKMEVVLTFDDGPHSHYTNTIPDPP